MELTSCVDNTPSEVSLEKTYFPFWSGCQLEDCFWVRLGSHIQSILAGISGETASKLGWNPVSTLPLSAFKVWTCSCSMHTVTVSVSFCVINPDVSERQFLWCLPSTLAFRTFLLLICHYSIHKGGLDFAFCCGCLFIFMTFFLLGSWVLSFILICISLSVNDA